MTIIRAMGLTLTQPVTLLPGLAELTLDSAQCLVEFTTEDGAELEQVLRVKIQIFPTTADLEQMNAKRLAALSKKEKAV